MRILPQAINKVRRKLSQIRIWFLNHIYKDYNRLYLKITKRNVQENPRAAVGPEDIFDEMREWQINFLIDQGLAKDDKLLDIGCGVLRGGIPLIEYLNPGNYYGMDISEEALDVGREFIDEHELEYKKPTLINNKDLRFLELELKNVTFDMVWAQSVLTHLPPEKIHKLLGNLPRVLSPEGGFYATYWESKTGSIERERGVDFYYPFSKIREIAMKHGFLVENIESDHPNDLQTLRFVHQSI